LRVASPCTAFSRALPSPVAYILSLHDALPISLTGYHPADPFSLRDEINYFSALNQPLKGWKIAYSPNLDVYPVDGKVAEVVANAVQKFKEAGAEIEEVTLGLQRVQQEYSDR